MSTAEHRGRAGDELIEAGGRHRSGGNLWLLLLLAVSFPLAHMAIYPYPVYLHPDTTGLVLAGEALAAEGRLVQPFRWDYIFEVSGKKVVSDGQPVVNLDEDTRVPGLIYPPGYSWIVAAGRRIGLQTSLTCRIAFYVALGLSSFCWLLWAQRSGVPLTAVCTGLLTALTIGPSTVTDPFGWLAAAAVLTIVTFEFRLFGLLLATAIMAWADLIRHAAILIGAASFWLWMTRPILMRQRLAVCVSCAAVLAVDMVSKSIRTGGGLDPMALFRGGWPDATEVVRAAYYAMLGGWVPESNFLKAALGVLAGIGTVGIFLRPRVLLQQRWVCDLIILQGATAFVLCIAQYKYGADFTKAPVAIARYWRYCAPGLACLHLHGIGTFLEVALGRSTRSVRLTRGLYTAVVILATLQLVAFNRDKWSGYSEGRDGFARRPMVADVHAVLQAHEERLVAVLSDNHQLTFTAVDPAKTKCLYYMSGFHSDSGGQIALVTGATERGEAVADVCDAELTLVSSAEMTGRVRVRIYEMPKDQVVRFGGMTEESSEGTGELMDSEPGNGALPAGPEQTEALQS